MTAQRRMATDEIVHVAGCPMSAMTEPILTSSIPINRTVNTRTSMCAAGRARTAKRPGRARNGQNHAAATATKSEKRTCTTTARSSSIQAACAPTSHQAAASAPRRDGARSDSDLARNGSTSAADNRPGDEEALREAAAKARDLGDLLSRLDAFDDSAPLDSVRHRRWVPVSRALGIHAQNDPGRVVYHERSLRARGLTDQLGWIGVELRDSTGRRRPRVVGEVQVVALAFGDPDDLIAGDIGDAAIERRCLVGTYGPGPREPRGSVELGCRKLGRLVVEVSATDGDRILRGQSRVHLRRDRRHVWAVQSSARAQTDRTNEDDRLEQSVPRDHGLATARATIECRRLGFLDETQSSVSVGKTHALLPGQMTWVPVCEKRNRPGSCVIDVRPWARQPLTHATYERVARL